MRNVRALLFTFLLIFALPAKIASFDLSSIPDGIPKARESAPYGAYHTPINGAGQKLDNTISVLASKVHGLALMSSEGEAKQAEAVFYLESLIIGTFLKITNSRAEDLTAFEKEALLSRTTRLYETLRAHHERLYETMLRKIDIALPGPNGPQIRIESNDPFQTCYITNCRSETPVSETFRKTFFEKKKKEFLEEGGSLSEIKQLTPELLASFGEYTRLEYVQRSNGEIWVTEGKAGHLLLADGGSVRAAGQIVILKDAEGKPSLAIVSNASGNFKPDMTSVRGMKKTLSQIFELDSDRILSTIGEPLGTQTTAILMKAELISSDQIKSKVKAMQKTSESLRQSPNICESALKKIQ
jgi:hypothetical protein